MDDEERKKKLLAGRERLAKFQKQKSSPDKKVKKKKKKKPAAQEDGTGVGNGESDVSTPGPMSDDSSYDQVDSSFASDYSSPLHSEDSDSHYDGGVSSPTHDLSRDRIIELEETLEGKELALQQMQQELEDANMAMEEARNHAHEMQAQAQHIAQATGGVGSIAPPSDESGAGADSHQEEDSPWQSASIQDQLSPDREGEYKAAIEQYNLKIMEFQTALTQRDDIIRQLSENLQGTLQSRDEVQREATNQAEQLTENIQSLQSQLRTAGETLQSQGKTQLAELAEELTQAHNQVVNLRQTLSDKDAYMHELANRYSQKSQELFDVKEEKETLARVHAGEVTALKQQVGELIGDDSSPRKDELIEILRADLDESYGKQMMLMKQQLLENHQQDMELLTQRGNELQVLARTNAVAADAEIGALQKKLEEKDAVLSNKEAEAEGLKAQLEKLVEVEREMKVKMDEMESEKEKEREYHAGIAMDLTDKLNVALSDNKDLTEIRDTYEGQITRLLKQLEETQNEGEKGAALAAEMEEERKKHGDEIKELQEQLERMNEDYQELAQIREAYEGQIARLSSELESKPSFDLEKVHALEEELEELKVSGPSMEKLQEIREEMAADIKRDYDDNIEDLKYNQEAELKRLKVQLDVEYTDKLKDATKAVEDQVEHKIKKAQTEKEHEFVAELQKARAELQEQYEEKLKQELESRLSKESQVEDNASQGGGVLAVLKDNLMTKLQTEVQDLSEVRDDLLERLEGANSQQESLREELASLTFEKNNLAEEVDQLKDELQGIHFQADTRVDTPFYDNERDELNGKLQVFNSRLQSQEQDHEIEVSGFIAKIEALKQEMAKANAAHEQEKGELDSKIQELESQLKDQADPLSDGRDHTGNLKEELEVLGETNANLVSEIERLEGQLLEARMLNDHHGKRAENLESQNRNLDSQVDKLQQQLEDSEEEMKVLQEAMAPLKDAQSKEMEQLKEERARLEKELMETKQELERVKPDASIEESRAEMDSKLKALEDEKRKTEEDLENARMECDSLREEVGQAEEKIRDLEGEVSRRVEEKNELDEKIADLDVERNRLLSEKENLQHQLESEEKERDVQVGALESRLESLSEERANESGQSDELREERDSALKTLESLPNQYRAVQAKNKELELQIANLEENLTRQQALQIVRDVEIMAQRETFDDAVADYDRLINDLKAEREEISLKLEAIEHEEGVVDSELPAVEEDLIVAREVATVAASAQSSTAEDSVDGQDYANVPSMLESTLEALTLENEDLKAKLLEASEENESRLQIENQLKEDIQALKTLLQEGEEEKGALEDMIQDEKSEIDELRMVEAELERENEELKDALEQQPKESEDHSETIEDMQVEVETLKKQLNDNQELFERENKLLQEALQEERDTTARLLNEGESPTSRDSLLQEIIDLKQRLAHKDQTEHEIVTEKNLQIGVLQETNAKLQQDNQDLHTKISDLEKRMQASEAISQEVQDTFGRQFMELKTEQSSLKEQLEKQKNSSSEGQTLDEQALREEALRCAKDMLLQKLEEKEAVEQQMLDEKMELQRQLGEQQSLEELLHEKDRLEQELARQKRTLQAEVKELEQKLQDQARKLHNEKSNMEAELQQKDFELRKWEANFREQQLEYRNREAFVRRRQENLLDGMKTDSEKESVARLEGMRLILERQHTEAVARLRRDLDQEFTAREGRLGEKHLSDISLLKTRHHNQLEEMQAEFEARIQGIKEELEEERMKQVGTVKSVHERMMEQDETEHLQTLQELRDQHEWEMEALKGELDLRQRQIFEELKAKMEEAHHKEKEALRHECDVKAQHELESIKSSLEQVYGSQTEALRADLDHDKAQALNELRRSLTLAHQEDLRELEEGWVARLEEGRKELALKTDEAVHNSQELITQLQRRLSLEHNQVVQTLAEQWDQEAVERLETVRAKMEAQYVEELEAEKREAEEKREGELETAKQTLEEEHKSDVELLLKEREMLVEHAEEMRQNLDKVHHKELDHLRASLKAEYNHYVRAKEELEISRSQSEASLIEELALLRIGHQELQQQYRADVTSLKVQLEQAGVPDPDQLSEENKELQTALTKLRAKLQEEHAEELDQLRVYFEKQVEDTEERWKTEMSELKRMYESPRGSSVKDSDEKEAKRSDYSHAMMTLTHLSDSDSSLPRSPPKFLEVEAELKQELRAQLEYEYQKDIRNLRQELQSEHEAEMARVKMEYDLQREEDMLKQEDRLSAKHTQDANDLELDYLNQFEELRNQLEGDHTREVARLRLEAAGEHARAVEEAVNQLTKEHDEALEILNKALEDRHAKENQEIRQEMSSELALAVADEMERLRETLQEEHMEEIENVRKQYDTQLAPVNQSREDNRTKEEVDKMNEDWQKERELIVKASKDEIVDEVARIVSDSTIESALLQVEIDTQGSMLKICLEELNRLKESSSEAVREQASSATEIEQLRQQLQESEERLHQLQENIKNGEAPEIQELKEMLMRDYDNRLEMITTTMNEEMDQLVRTTQLQARTDVEKMQEDFAAQHQALMDRFVEDQEKALGELREEHEEELAKVKEELLKEHAENQQKAMDELRHALETSRQQEMEAVRKSHAEELEDLRLDMMKLTDEERERLEEKMMEERRGVEEVEKGMKEMAERHGREMEEMKENLVLTHMEKFRQVTAELEESHKQELEASHASLQSELESSFSQQLSALQEEQQSAAQQHEEEMRSLKESHDMKLVQVEEEHADQMAALGSAQEADVETAKGDLEEVHRKEIIDLQNRLEAQKQRDIEELQSAFEEAKKMLMDSQDEALTKMEAEGQEKMREMEREREEALAALREELSHSAEQEKGETDQLVKEQQNKWMGERDALTQESEQLKEENAALLEKLAERESVIGRSKREHEEGSTLLAMLRSDLDRLGTERDGLQQTNNHLLRVLTQVVQTTMATENNINRRLGSGSRPIPSHQQELDRRGDGRPSSPRMGYPRGAVGGDSSSDGDALHDTSVASMFSDEGLELSQHVNESMFVGPDLDSEGEEIVTGATNRLHSAVEHLLDRYSDSSTQSDQRRPVQAEGYASSASSREEDSSFSQGPMAGGGAGGDREELIRRLQAEIREKERLAVELHKSDGLLDGISAEKADVEEALRRAQERYHQMVVEMENLSERLTEVTQANQGLQDAQEQFEQQRAVLAERLGLEDLGLIEENTQLRQQIQALTQEHRDLELQAAKTKSYLEQQVHAMESTTEEQIAGSRKREEEARLRAEDLQRQVDAAKKMQSSHKQFLEQQSVDREQEREEFQREIVRLEEDLKLKERPGGTDIEQLKKENQDLKEEISHNQNEAVASASRIQQLEKEVSWKQDTVTELARQIKELERQIDDNKKLPAQVAELEAELRGQRHLEEEMRHEKEALQKQCYDQLLQISALQSKLDAHKHGLDARVGPSSSSNSSKSLDDTNEGPMSLAQQWEQDKEALERKDKEIEALVEQLEQFRDGLTNKDEEIGQLQLQLEVASKEQGSGREDMEQAINQVKEENERLKDELHAPSISSLDQEQQSTLPRLAQDLLEEKNIEIDQLTEHIQELERSLEDQGQRREAYESREIVMEEVVRVERRSAEALGSPDSGARAQEMDQLRLKLEREVAAKDQELGRLRQHLSERGQDGNPLTNPAVVEVLDRMRQHTHDEEEQRKQLEQEVVSLRQITGIREREVAQLEAQLVRTQEQSLSQGEEEHEAQLNNETLRKTIEEKELEIMNLKVEMDRLEETVFQSQQRERTASPSASNMEEMERMRKNQEETIRRLEEEIGQERSRASEMEADYQRRMAGLKGLSPGKTLTQKLNEIREELTRQHQQHVADIQRTMTKEAELRIEQLKKEHVHQIQLLEERHHSQVQEAVLRTNQDLLVAHGEEKARIEEEHRRQMERVAAATPVNVSSLGDMGSLLHKEVETTARLDSNLLGHLRRRQGGVGREQPLGEGSMTNGDVPELDMTNGEIPPRLQSVLARLHSEGLQVLSLSDLRYLRQATSPRPSARRGTDIATLQNAWQNEKQALLDAIQALKDLITHSSAGLGNDELDWRGDLLRAIQAVFDQERESLLAELRTHVVASGDQDLSQVQLLERRIREQESHHKAAMEQIYGADRASLLAEVHDLRVNHNSSRIELQEVRQRSTQQLSALEEQSSNREKQLKRQLETMEHKFRQERILADDLRTSLTIERQKLAQLGASLSNEKKLVSELHDEIAELQALVDRLHAQKDDVENRMADVGAALEAEKMRSTSLLDSLESEKRNVEKLHDALNIESDRAAKARDRDQKLARELRKELEAERLKSSEIIKSLDAAKERTQSLDRELEAERTQSATTVSSEKMKMIDLKRALDMEKTRYQEVHTSLQREQTLNAQIHENLEHERRSFAEDSLRDKSTVADLQNLLEGERRKASELHSTIQQLESQVGRLEGVLQSQRSQETGAVGREKAANRKLKESLESLNAQCRDLSSKLAAAQETSSRAQADRDRLQATLNNQKVLQMDQEASMETEREAEKQKQKERVKEKEMEKQRQRDRDLERQLDKQKIDSLEDELIEAQRVAKRLERENKRFQESQASDDRHRTVEMEPTSETGSPYSKRRDGGASRTERVSLDLYKGQLESVRQRLQLMAVKQQEELSKIERATLGVDNVPSSTQHELRSVEGSLIELITELRQIHAALALLSESQPPLVTSTAARVNERLLQQNSEMSSYVSQLSTEKSELREALSKLEEEIWQYRQREVHRHQSPRGDRDMEALLARERATWAKECLATQNSLQDAERQIAQLKLDLERGTLRREHVVNGEVSTMEQQQQQKIQRLYGKYLRAESFRKALVYQKKYLLLLLGGFQDCEQATLSLIAKMGAYPSPEDLRDHPSRHSKAFSRFRSAARVIIAVSRLKFLVKKWRRATRAGSREIMGSGATPPSGSLTQRTSVQAPHPATAAHPTTTISSATAVAHNQTSHDSLPHRYTSPLRASPRIGEYPADSPPVRDRGAYGSINGMAHSGAAGGHIPVGRTRPVSSPGSYRHGASPLNVNTSPGARPGDAHSDRLGVGAGMDAGLNESDGSFYIRKIETLQERLGAIAGRKTTQGREHGSSSRFGYSKR